MILSRDPSPPSTRLLARLDALEPRVPAQARRVREMVRALRGRIEEAGRRRILRFRPAELEQFGDDLRRLEEAAPHLAQLFDQAESARGKLRGLRLRVSDPREPADQAWIEARCVQWEAALNSLGATLPRPADLARARLSVAELVTEVTLHDDAIEWLARSRRVLQELSDHGLELQGAALRADLPATAEELRSEGPSRRTLDELAAEVRALEEIVAAQPKEAPIEYTDAAKVLDRVEAWHEVLEPLEQASDRDFAALRELRDRLETARRMWRRRDPEDAEAVLVDARAMLAGTEEDGRRYRAEAIHELRGQVRYLSLVADSSEAENELAELEARGVDAPREHSLWWSELIRIWTGFFAEAENDGEELVDRREERRCRLAEALAELAGAPLSATGRSRLFQLEGELQGIGQSSDVKEVLRNLQHLDRLHEDAEELRADSERERRALAERREALRDRLRDLLGHGRRAEVPARSQRSRLRSLFGPDAPSSLEEAQAAVAEIEQEAERAERDFVAACHRAVQEAADATATVARALDAAGSGPDPWCAPPEPPAGATAAEAADAVVEARRQLGEIETRAEAARDRLEQHRDDLLTRLGELPVATLRPGDRDDLARIAGELRAAAGTPTASAVERLELLAPVIGRGQELLDLLAHDEQEARGRLEELKRRFDRFKAEGLHHRCGELTDRLEALIRGVPDSPIRWLPVLRQLGRAEELLSRLEIHARRLTVAELDDALLLLEKRRDRVGDEERDRLIAELREIDPHELPPAALRRRIARCIGGGGAAHPRNSHG